jgi:DHA1 family bicyclomycin/chloramphenicol resistance-like MFS transporter
MSAPALMSQFKASVVGALLVALGPISMALYTPAMPTLVKAFDTDVSSVKLTLTVYFLGFALAQLVCGPLSDAWGRRPIVMIFTALYFVGGLMAVFAPSIIWLLAARIVQGVGAAAGIAIARAIVRDLFTGRQSAQVMNMIGLMLIAAPAMAPTIGGLTLEFLGWRAIFVMMAAYGVAIMITFSMFVPETRPPHDPSDRRSRGLLASYATLIRDPRFLRPSIVMACSIGSIYTLATILPFVLIDQAGMTPVQFGFAMLAQSGAFMVGSVVMRSLLKTIDAHRLVPFGLALSALGALGLPVLVFLHEPSFLTVMGPTAVLAFGIPFVMPSMLTESLAPFPHIAGAASALGGFFQMGAGLVGSAIAAAMGDAVMALYTVIPTLAIMSVVTQVLLRHATTRMEAAVADRIVRPHAPAE